jgi:hypothetical protein
MGSFLLEEPGEAGREVGFGAGILPPTINAVPAEGKLF